METEARRLTAAHVSPFSYGEKNGEKTVGAVQRYVSVIRNQWLDIIGSTEVENLEATWKMKSSCNNPVLMFSSHSGVERSGPGVY